MIEYLNFDKLNFSKLFLDFISKNNAFLNQFQDETLLNNYDYLSAISRNSNRNNLQEVIINSFEDIELTIKQKENLNSIANKTTLAIVTGQQIGLFGGPIYTFLKIQSAITLAKKLNEKGNVFKFVPIFWIEDNDHDKEESGTSYLYDFTSNIHQFKLNYPSDKSSSATQIYDESVENLKKLTEECLVNFRYKEESLSLLNNSYINGESWTTGFIKLLNSFFADDGLLFVSANKAMKSDIFSELIKKEIQNSQTTFQLIQNDTEKLIQNGYHSQVKPSQLNLFYHHNNERTNFLDDIANQNNISDFSNYSPKALLRPVFQDYLIPTVAYIAGPGEISYLLQTKSIYDFFEVKMPVIIARHSATIIDRKTAKFLKNNDIEPTYFANNYKSIESELSKKFVNQQLNDFFEFSKSRLSELFDEITKEITQIDKQLDKTSETAKSKAIEQVENLEKKVVSALKRNNADLLRKYQNAKNMLFPEDKPQERFYSILNLVAENSKHTSKEILEEICEERNNTHILYWIE